MDEEHDALAGKAVAPLETFVSHMQLDVRIDGRDHECLGDDSLRVRRRGYEPSDQQGGYNGKLAHRVPLQAVLGFLSSAHSPGAAAAAPQSFTARTYRCPDVALLD